MTGPFRTLLPFFDELEGERVIVRPYRESDAQALFEAIAESRDHIRPWLPFADEHQTVDETKDWIIHTIAKFLLRDDMFLGIWERHTNRYLGGTGLHPRNWEIGYFEIGYWLRLSAEGHGYMTETVKLLVDYAFLSYKARRIEIRCDGRNTRSAAVPRRLGFTQEACLRQNRCATDGSLRDTLVFSLIREDYVVRLASSPVPT